MLEHRNCTECGAALTDEHVMKIALENESWETIPLTICPECFKKQMRKLALKRQESRKQAEST